METAKFANIRQAKGGKIVGSIQFEGGKVMSVPPGVELNLAMNQKTCEIMRIDGQIKEMRYEGRMLMPQASKQMQSPQRDKPVVTERKPIDQSGKSQNSDRAARAPYNFVPLNRSVVVVEDPAGYDRYDEGRLSGYIQIDLKTLTPLYIRDNLDVEQMKQNQENNQHPDFFAPAGNVRIPGSSIRGMVRTLVEILGWGNFRFYQDKLLFYRSVADQSNLQQEYHRNITRKVQAGYLRRNGLKYFIVPAKVENGEQYKQVRKVKPDEEFTYKKHQNNKVRVISGDMKDKDNDWLINPPDEDFQKRIPINSVDIEAYQMDDNRYQDKSMDNEKQKRDGDLLRLLSVREEESVPCFYVCWKDDSGKDRVSFGHTGYFRLAYRKTIGDHIPALLKDGQKLDIAEAIFGKAFQFSSRVFFEDAILTVAPKEVFEIETIPQILSSPKPTTFQHYLEQRKDANVRNLHHWNSSNDCHIRGYKVYWHRPYAEWKEVETVEKNDSQHTKIKPIKPGISFQGKIRFENLTEVELGALLFALDLKENHFHKLGMGKPLGLGTVKFTPTLFLCDRKQRYSKLFDGNGWHLADERVADKKPYKDAFEAYVLERISSEERVDAHSLWETERLKELEAMLDWRVANEKEWEEATRYMQLEHPQNKNEFKTRPILARPQEYREKFREKLKMGGWVN